MKRFVLKVAFLGIIVTVLLLSVFTVGERLATKVFGPNTKTQIEESFQNALTSCATNWILGNSRVYRGLNPDKMSKSWYNFAHDNDSYNQMYYKLQFLLNNNRIDTLIIGTDYFQFSVFSDTRNYVYDGLLGKEYIKDYNTWRLKEFYCNYKRLLITKQSSFHSALLNVNSWLGGGKKNLPYLRANGQYINDLGNAKEDDYVARDSILLDIQKKYFKELLITCKNQNIDLYVLMMPVRDNELSCYNESFTNTFKDYIKSSLKDAGYENHYIDMSNITEFKDYKMYTDITHFNSESADRYTKCFYKELESNN
jgi:hypothetical protein